MLRFLRALSLFGLLATVFAHSLNAQSTSTLDQICGDVIVDGGVDLADFQEILHFIASFPQSGVDITQSGEYDGYAGLSFRDLIVLYENIWSPFFPHGICPATQPRYQLSSSPDFLIRHQTYVPANVDRLDVQLYYDFTSPAEAIHLPFRAMIEGEVARIDSISLPSNISFRSGFPIEGRPTERNLLIWKPTTGLPNIGMAPSSIAHVYLSFLPVSHEREITIELLSRPSLPTLSDSLIEAAVYTASATFSPVGWTPEVRNYLCGDVSGDGSIDIIDLTFVVDHLFITFGEMPVPAAGNVNAADAVDLLDVTALVDFLFLGGPPPGRC